MKTLFWKAYYRLKFGEEYGTRMKNAAALGRTIDQTTTGSFSALRYNAKGEQIRGWHRRTRFNENTPIQHPLITKYSQV